MAKSDSCGELSNSVFEAFKFELVRKRSTCERLNYTKVRTGGEARLTKRRRGEKSPWLIPSVYRQYCKERDRRGVLSNPSLEVSRK